MTRILDCVDCPSLSEPHFLDTIYDLLRLGEDISMEEIETRLRTCLMLERQLMKNQYPRYRGLSIKPRMGIKFIDELKRVFPDSRHMLVYRNCGPTVESLASISHKHLSNGRVLS